MHARPKILRNLSHWGAFRATVSEGRLVAVAPFEHDPEPNPLIEAWVEMLHSPLRVARPALRRGFLAGDGGQGRGEDSFVEVPWDEALDLVADNLSRIRSDDGPAAVLGGSYGWASAGRLHHSRTLLRRFLNLTGGHTDQVNNYSYGSAMVLLPRLFGRRDIIGGQVTQIDTIARETDLFLAFGGLPRRPWANQSGGAGEHHYEGFMAQVTARARLVNISPVRADVPDPWPSAWLPIRPGSDAALLLALAQEVVAAGGADHAFLDRCCEGHQVVLAYLAGQSDGVVKDAAWAAPLTGIDAERIRELARSLIGKRVMLSATWSLQRAEHGEQPYWAMVTLAAILGQIGQPGGGFAFGYGSSGGMGNPAYAPPLYALPTGTNPAASQIPVSRVADALLNPRGAYRYDGQDCVFPDLRMVWWAGGNPFMHHQDLNRLREAFRRPEVVVVNECFWTATARHADIVLPATTTLERNDIGGSSRDPWLMAMHKLVEPQGEARNDFDIFADVAQRLGVRETFTDGLDEQGLLARAWAQISARLAQRGIPAPDFDDFWQTGYLKMPKPAGEYTMLQDFTSNPSGRPLPTPSGRIELYSKALHAEANGTHPGHAAWLPPREWLGQVTAQSPYRLHLLSPQPEQRLHGQLDGSAYGETFKADGREFLQIHPEDAQSRGIADRQPVRLFNDRGACHAVARLNPGLSPGVVILPTGASYDPAGFEDRNSNPNVLTQDIGTSEMTQGCSAQSCLVEVSPVAALPRLTAYQPPAFTTKP